MQGRLQIEGLFSGEVTFLDEQVGGLVDPIHEDAPGELDALAVVGVPDECGGLHGAEGLKESVEGGGNRGTGGG